MNVKISSTRVEKKQFKTISYNEAIKKRIIDTYGEELVFNNVSLETSKEDLPSLDDNISEIEVCTTDIYTGAGSYVNCVIPDDQYESYNWSGSSSFKVENLMADGENFNGTPQREDSLESLVPARQDTKDTIIPIVKSGTATSERTEIHLIGALTIEQI